MKIAEKANSNFIWEPVGSRPKRENGETEETSGLCGRCSPRLSRRARPSRVAPVPSSSWLSKPHLGRGDRKRPPQPSRTRRAQATHLAASAPGLLLLQPSPARSDGRPSGAAAEPGALSPPHRPMGTPVCPALFCPCQQPLGFSGDPKRGPAWPRAQSRCHAVAATRWASDAGLLVSFRLALTAAALATEQLPWVCHCF